MDKVTEILEETINILNDGWCQGKYNQWETDKETGEQVAVRSCLVGAIRRATCNVASSYWTMDELDLEARAKRRVMDVLPDGFRRIPHYNDNEFVTKEDVILLVKQAIYKNQETE